MRFLLLLVGLLAFPGLMLPAIPPFRVATWNLRNFLLQNRFEHGKFRFQYPKPELEKVSIRDVLLSARPDIVFLQELGSPAFLLELQRDLAASGLDYPYSQFSRPPESRSGLGYLSRVAPRECIFHDPVPVPSTGIDHASMPRGIQEVAFPSRAGSLRFFHLHLKSRYSSSDTDPESRFFREAEVKALARFLSARLTTVQPNERLFLVGDFNTPFEAPILKPLHAHWAPLPAVDNHGLPWTYHHFKSASREQIDGFWEPRPSLTPPSPGRLLPDPSPDPAPSDHRLVLISLPAAPPALFKEKRLPFSP